MDWQFRRPDNAMLYFRSVQIVSTPIKQTISQFGTVYNHLSLHLESAALPRGKRFWCSKCLNRGQRRCNSKQTTFEWIATSHEIPEVWRTQDICQRERERKYVFNTNPPADAGCPRPLAPGHVISLYQRLPMWGNQFPRTKTKQTYRQLSIGWTTCINKACRVIGMTRSEGQDREDFILQRQCAFHK